MNQSYTFRITDHHLVCHEALNFVDLITLNNLINYFQMAQFSVNTEMCGIIPKCLRDRRCDIFLVSEYFWDQSQPRPLCPVFLSRDQQLCGFNRITGLVWPKSKECIYFDVPGYKAQISHISHKTWLFLY